MRKSKFTEHPIVAILNLHEADVNVADQCRKHGISNVRFYQWKANDGGQDASQLKQLKDLLEGNGRLRLIHAKLCMMHDSLKRVVDKKWGPRRSAGSCRPL